MSISQPSRLVYVVDVPETEGVQATFEYNFFTPDECVNATGGVPSIFLTRPGAEIDSAFIQYSVTRAPRAVKITWTPTKLGDVGNQVSAVLQRNKSFNTSGVQNGSLILDNLSSVINEDAFASNNYVNVHFCDGNIDSKVHEIVSGTMTQQMLQLPTNDNTTTANVAATLSTTLPGYVDQNLINQALSQASQSGVTFSAQSVTDGQASSFGLKGGSSAFGTFFPIKNEFFSSLKRAGINVQINTKYMYDLIDRAIADPTATTATDLVNIQGFSKQAKQSANQRGSSTISEDEFKTTLTYFDVQSAEQTSFQAQKYGLEIVGYIIDKFEVSSDGTTTVCPPIVIDDPSIGLTADYQVKFNTNYCYMVRTIAVLTLPAVNDDGSGDIAITKTLVSSKPSQRVTISTLKLDAPPPPGDINFVWNYGTNRLMVTWAFPVTSERDIKQFQVFRRSTVLLPFELHKQYNFDDSYVPFPCPEVPDPSLLETLTDPCCWWIDDTFDWDVNTTSSKGYIYAVAAIDAHGQTSNYSAQFLVWFDRFQNKIQKKLISHIGAPKSYPNMYVEGQLFIDTIRTSGKPNMSLYFNPQYYYTTDDTGRSSPALQTIQNGGAYKLQFINVDNFGAAEVDITINDLTSQVEQPIAPSIITFGPKRRNLSNNQ